MNLSPVLHIGWARAASTAFRRNFLKRHPEILAVGRDQPFSEGPAAVALHHVKRATGAEFRHFRRELRSEWAAYQRDRKERVICLTDEELSIGLRNSNVPPVEIAGRCAELFPNARILAIVRNQVDAIRSFYALSLMVAHPTTASFAEWVEQFFINPAGGKDHRYLFSYMTTLRAFLEWVPKHDIFVLPYDRLTNDPFASYRDISRWLDISQEASAHFPNDRVNVSPPIGSLSSRISNGRKASSSAERTSNEYSTGQEHKIRKLFEADNSELAYKFGVTFSYPG